jgi:Homeodomain-like domain
VNTVADVRRRFVQRGEPAALERKVRLTPPVPSKLDGASEAELIAICCSTAPQGRSHWTMQMLADELVSRRIVLSISDETVRTRLKKMTSSPGEPGGFAFPRRTRLASSRRWKRSWTSMPSRSIPASR